MCENVETQKITRWRSRKLSIELDNDFLIFRNKTDGPWDELVYRWGNP